MKRKNQSILIVLTIIIFISTQFALYYMTSLSKGVEVTGTDTFTRLVRVTQLHETKDWYDNVLYDSNAPYGDELHWGRALDVILLVMAKGLSLFIPFKSALLISGILLSPLMGAMVLILLYWTAKPIMKEHQIPIIFLILFTQPILFEIFNFGRPDHHGLLLMTFVLVLGTLVRLVEKQDKKYLWLTGFLLAFSMSVSVEAIILVVMVFATLSVLWLLWGRDYLDKALTIAWGLTVFSAVFLMIERPMSTWADCVYDRHSLVYLVFFFICALIFWGLKTMDKRLPNPSEKISLKRLMLLLATGAVGGTVMILVFPQFIKGPFSDVNPEIVPIWLSKVREVQPMFSLSLTRVGKAIIYLGMPFLAIVYLVIKVLKDAQKEDLIFLIGMTLYGLLSLIQIRWTGYLQMLALIPGALFFDYVIQRVIQKRQGIMVPLLRSLTILVLLFGFTAIGVGMMVIDQQPVQSTMAMHDLEVLCDWMNEEMGTDQTVLTFIDFGPEIMYRTSHRVIATPYHRNDEGILFYYKAMTQTEMETIRAMLLERQVDWILIAPNSTEQVLFKTMSGETLYQLLVQGHYPDWLTQVQLPESLSAFKLFRINE